MAAGSELYDFIFKKQQMYGSLYPSPASSLFNNLMQKSIKSQGLIHIFPIMVQRSIKNEHYRMESK